MRASLVLVGVLVVLCTGPRAAHAVPFGGVEFPEGTSSFADAVVSYVPVIDNNGNPTVPYRGAVNALGTPSGSDASCVSQPSCAYVTLGDGGSLTLEFVSNRLTGSGDVTNDLWVFEVGAAETTFVEVSPDGVTFTSVGSVPGGTSGIDLDAFGIGPTARLRFVRLTDDVNEVVAMDATRGADLDAVGASSTVATPIPEPATLLLLGSGLAGLGAVTWRRARRKWERLCRRLLGQATTEPGGADRGQGGHGGRGRSQKVLVLSMRSQRRGCHADNPRVRIGCRSCQRVVRPLGGTRLGATRHLRLRGDRHQHGRGSGRCERGAGG